MIKKALLIIAVLFISINSNFLSNNQEFYFDYQNKTQSIQMKVGEVIYIHGDCNQSNGYDFYLDRNFEPSELVSIEKQNSFIYDEKDNLFCRYIVTAKEAGNISLKFILHREPYSFTDMFANIVIQ